MPVLCFSTSSLVEMWMAETGLRTLLDRFKLRTLLDRFNEEYMYNPFLFSQFSLNLSNKFLVCVFGVELKHSVLLIEPNQQVFFFFFFGGGGEGLSQNMLRVFQRLSLFCIKSYHHYSGVSTIVCGVCLICLGQAYRGCYTSHQ